MKKVFVYSISYSEKIVDISLDVIDAEIIKEDDMFYDVKESDKTFSINKNEKIIKSMDEILNSDYIYVYGNKIMTGRHKNDNSFFQTYTLGFVYDTNDDIQKIDTAKEIVNKSVNRYYSQELDELKITFKK